MPHPVAITHGGNLFAVARQRGWDWREVLEFSASINPLGPSPRVRPAIEAAIDRIVHYPDRYGDRLAERLAAEWNVAPEQVLVGNGATDLIHFLARTYPQAALVVPTFSEFHRAWPEAPWIRHDKPWPHDRLVVITRPNNPTGAMPRINHTGPMLIDESFIDFSDERSMCGQSLVLRSLTKFYAMPGLRVGALVGPADVIARLKEKREPWQLNVLAEAAAIAALDDREHAQASRQFVRAERARMMCALSTLADPIESAANYIYARVAYPSAALCEWMLEDRILIRDCSNWPGCEGEAVRVAIRSREDNDRLIARWKEFRWSG
jgi:threonine-phosphate decarboxylase